MKLELKIELKILYVSFEWRLTNTDELNNHEFHHESRDSYTQTYRRPLKFHMIPIISFALSAEISPKQFNE